MSAKVLDYSFARPDLKKIKSLGYDGVMRYLSYGSTKNLTAEELKDIFKAKLKCGLVWETGAQAMKGGAKAGKEDAKMALHYAGLFGFPKETPIYFAADWDTTPADQKPIDEYLKACSDVIGKERVGVYGSFYVIERCHKNKTAQWFWQTLAWSGHQVSKYNHLLQDLKEPGIAGTDHNIAVDEWGGWDGTMVPKVEENATIEAVDPIESTPQVEVETNQPQEQPMLETLKGSRTIISAVLAFVVSMGMISQVEADQLTEGLFALASVATLVSTLYFRVTAKLK